MTFAAHARRLPKQSFLFSLAFAMTTAATADDGARPVPAIPLEAPMPAVKVDAAVPLIAQRDQDEPSDLYRDQREAAKPFEAARKKVAALLNRQKEQADKQDSKKHDRDKQSHGHRDGAHRPAMVNVIVTVNVNSGNLFGPFGLPRHDDESRSSAGRQEFERVVREHEATIDRLRHELETLRNRVDSPEAREQQFRNARDRFDQMRQEMRNRMEEMHREREERARQQETDAAKDAAEDAERDAADDAAGPEASDAAAEDASSESF